MSLIDLLKWRYATKKMNGEKVAQSKVDTILDAIQNSASSFGLQPYKVLVIENQALKERMVEAAWGQLQVKDCSHLLVFASKTSMSSADVEEYISNTAKTRNLPIESLNDYKNMILGKIGSMSAEHLAAWNARQAYIALGTALIAAAEQKVDATPMEGFVPEQIDEILQLPAKGLTAVILMPLGYRDAGDWLAPLAKVRKSKDQLFEVIK